MSPPTMTMGRLFAAALAGLLAIMLGLLGQADAQSRAAILVASEHARDDVGKRVAAGVGAAVSGAERAARDISTQIALGVLNPDDPGALEGALFAAILRDDALAEVTFTRASLLDPEAAEPLPAPSPRFQVSLQREPDGRIVTRWTHPEAGGFVMETRQRPLGGSLRSAERVREPLPVADPTDHATFRTAAAPRFRGQAVWSDLHPSELDSALPEGQRRIVVTVQREVSAAGGLVGVVRSGLRVDQVERILWAEARDYQGHRIFLGDEQGRLITRFSESDRLVENTDEAFRVEARGVPAEVRRALELPPAARAFEDGGLRYLVSFRALEGSQGWRIGVLAPENVYLGEVIAARARVVRLLLAAVALVGLGALVTLRTVQSAFARIAQATARMADFDFAPLPVHSRFRDVQAVMERLEQAKTALRTLGRYVPVDLVRLLYRSRREPVLGGEMVDISMMFSDIEGFTSIAERLPPNDLAKLLGRYLEVMTGEVHGAAGTVDKYIGDAVMALWNVPTPCPDHPLAACRAALACQRATAALCASPEWEGSPALHTRIGLHRDTVMVGHFGAPDRLSYTALGDGVNLASRLEGLNKQYGTSILVSEAIREAAGPAFSFRLLDLVAVKGKQRGVRIFELLGEAGPLPEAVRRYEQAFAAYLSRDFAGAAALLEGQPEDPPGRALLARCRKLLEVPPGPDWNGVHVASEK
jgi:adenylate cyclase